MKTFQITKNIKIEAEYYKTRYSWGHKAWLYLDNEKIAYKKITYYNRAWESYEFESILYAVVEKAEQLTKRQVNICHKYIKNYNERDPFLKTVAIVAKMGEVFADNQKDKNDWKARMLKAGLENKGLIMPEDWESLSEDDKQKRLDGAIKQLVK